MEDAKDTNPVAQPPINVIVNQPNNSKSNGFGIAGFVLALLAIFLGWIPVLGWIIWLLGLVFSVVGLFRVPKGLAIAGVVLSFLGLIFLLAVFAAIGSFLALSL